MRTFILLISVCLLLFCAGCTEGRQKAHEDYNRAVQQMADGDYAKAAEAYRSAIKHDPHFVEANLGYQDLKMQIGQHASLLAEYKKLLATHPDDPYFNFYYGRILKNSNERTEQYKNALKSDPDFLWAINGIGNEYLKQGEVEDAIRQMKKVIEIDSEFAPVHFSLASALYAKGSYESALSEIKKFLQLKPDDYAGSELAGKLYFAKEDYKTALQYFDRATELQSNYTSSRYQAARTLFKLKQYKQAEVAAQQILKMNPTHMDALLLKAELMLEKKEIKAASDAVYAVLNFVPHNLNALKLKARIEELSLGSGERVYRQIILISPEDPVACYELGKIEFKKRAISVSYDYFKKAANSHKAPIEYLRAARDTAILLNAFAEAEGWNNKIPNSDRNGDDLLKEYLVALKRDSKYLPLLEKAIEAGANYDDFVLYTFLSERYLKHDGKLSKQLLDISDSTKDQRLKRLLKLEVALIDRKYDEVAKSFNAVKNPSEIERALYIFSLIENSKLKADDKILDSFKKESSNIAISVNAAVLSIPASPNLNKLKLAKLDKLFNESELYPVRLQIEREKNKLYTPCPNLKESKKKAAKSAAKN